MLYWNYRKSDCEYNEEIEKDSEWITWDMQNEEFWEMKQTLIKAKLVQIKVQIPVWRINTNLGYEKDV